MHLKRLIKINEFLCSLFNIKYGREKQHFWHIMLYYFKKGQNAAERHKKDLCSVWRRCYDSSDMFVKFCAGDFSLDDVPWWGRPVEVDRDQIEILTENNQC